MSAAKRGVPLLPKAFAYYHSAAGNYREGARDYWMEWTRKKHGTTKPRGPYKPRNKPAPATTDTNDQK